jgi:lipid-A-disaccharide synthase
MNQHYGDVVIITNSPGELSSWARVMTDSIKTKRPDARVIIMLVPCPYATGKEEEIARKFPAVDIVFSPKDFLRFIFFNKTPGNFKFSQKGIVFFLGGDFWHAASAAWKLNFPAIAYTARADSGWNSRFRYILCPDERIRRGLLELKVPDRKIKVVGNLIVEGVKPTIAKSECQRQWNLDPSKLTIGIFPGSRIYHMQDSLPVFLKVAEEVKQEEPNVQFIIGLSPFINPDEISQTLASPRSPIEGVKGAITNSDGALKVVTSGGVTIPVFQSLQYDVMNTADIIITIPGTNTAECAYLGKPMVVSSSWKARIPRGGLGFFMNSLPIGNLRKKLYLGMLEKLKYTALPNMIAQRSIVPEVFVNDSSKEISDVVVKMIKDEQWREKISDELKQIMGKTGAAKKITDLVFEVMQDSGPEAL